MCILHYLCSHKRGSRVKQCKYVVTWKLKGGWRDKFCDNIVNSKGIVHNQTQ